MPHSLAHAGGHCAQGHCSPAGDLGPDLPPNSAPSRLRVVSSPHLYCSPCTPAPRAAHPAVPSGHPGSSSLGAVPGLAVSLHICGIYLGHPQPFRPWRTLAPALSLPFAPVWAFLFSTENQNGGFQGPARYPGCPEGTWLITPARLASTLGH